MSEDAPETVADRIRQRLKAVNKTPHGASVEAGGGPSLIPNILNGRSKNPRIDTLNKIAPVLETTGEWLMNGDKAPEDERASEVRLAIDAPDRLTNLPKDVPVLGTVAGSELGSGAFQLTSDVVDYVRRPFGLIGAKDVYALYVEGVSMLPKFEPGELVFVHPHRKARTGDYVVIQEPDSNRGEPRGFIKKLVAVTGTQIKTEQFNPPAKIDFLIRPGVTWHKVMTASELYGL